MHLRVGPVALPRGRRHRRPHTIGHECVGIIEEVGDDVRDFARRRLRGRAVRPLRQHLPALPAGPTPAARTSASRQRPGGVHLRHPGRRHPGEDRRSAGRRPGPRRCMALSDVMATGWHAAVSAGVRGAAPPSSSATAPSACAACWPPPLGAETVIAMSRHASRQEIARKFGATHVVEERGKEGAPRSTRSSAASAATPSWSASATGRRSRRRSCAPAPAPRSAWSAYRTGSSCRCA